jgi:hypothetical protein
MHANIYSSYNYISWQCCRVFNKGLHGEPGGRRRRWKAPARDGITSSPTLEGTSKRRDYKPTNLHNTLVQSDPYIWLPTLASSHSDKRKAHDVLVSFYQRYIYIYYIYNIYYLLILIKSSVHLFCPLINLILPRFELTQTHSLSFVFVTF